MTTKKITNQTTMFKALSPFQIALGDAIIAALVEGYDEGMWNFEHEERINGCAILNFDGEVEMWDYTVDINPDTATINIISIGSLDWCDAEEIADYVNDNFKLD